MHSIVTLALKDLRVLSRDWFGLFWIVVFPLVYALFFGSVFSGAGPGQTGSMKIAVIDQEGSVGSSAFLSRLKEKNAALDVKTMALPQAQEAVRKGNLAAYLVLKSGFAGGGNPFGGQPRQIEMGLDPTRKAEGKILEGFIMEAVFADFKDLFGDPRKGRDLAKEAIQGFAANPKMTAEEKKTWQGVFGLLDQFLEKIPDLNPGDHQENAGFEFVKIEVANQDRETRAGPRASSEISFPQSVLWAIMGGVTTFAVSLVLERTKGTYLRLRTGPLTRGQILAGKGLACFMTCVGVTCMLLVLGGLFLGLRLNHPVHLALAIGCTAFCFTGIMMFLSTLGKTEQGVAGASWGMLMPMAMIGGGMIPLFVMPSWMQQASNISPIKWGIYSLEGAIWRDFTLAEMLLPCGILLLVGAVFFALGVAWLGRQDS